MSPHSAQPRSGQRVSQQRPRLGRRMARFNRAVTNKVSVHVAGWAPGMGVVTHVGRRTRTVYRTPVNVFRTKDGFRFALTYGRDAEWVRDLRLFAPCDRRIGAWQARPNLYSALATASEA